jgi:hypothetical protein
LSGFFLFIVEEQTVLLNNKAEKQKNIGITPRIRKSNIGGDTAPGAGRGDVAVTSPV